MSAFISSSLGAETYSETMKIFGTVRGRVGYAPGNWLFYATGGYAWTYNQAIVDQIGSGPTDSPFLWRFGWVAGGGVEFPIKPHWTASLEYLYTHYSHTGTFFPNAGQGSDSDFSLQQLRLGLNYRFGDVIGKAPVKAPARRIRILSIFTARRRSARRVIRRSDRLMRAQQLARRVTAA